MISCPLLPKQQPITRTALAYLFSLTVNIAKKSILFMKVILNKVVNLSFQNKQNVFFCVFSTFSNKFMSSILYYLMSTACMAYKCMDFCISSLSWSYLCICRSVQVSRDHGWRGGGHFQGWGLWWGRTRPSAFARWVHSAGSWRLACPRGRLLALILCKGDWPLLVSMRCGQTCMRTWSKQRR